MKILFSYFQSQRLIAIESARASYILLYENIMKV